MYLFFSLLLSFLNEYFYRLRWKARSFMYFMDSFIITLWSYHPYQRTIRKLRVNGSKKVELPWWKNGSIFERKIWQWLIKTESNEMALIWVNNHVVFIKPFWYYHKVMSESVDHNISVFVWGMHSIFFCMVATCSTFNKTKKIINENVWKQGVKDRALMHNGRSCCHLLKWSPTFVLWFLFEYSIRKLRLFYRSHKVLIYIECCFGLAY